jgi:hypothetical protein
MGELKVHEQAIGCVLPAGQHRITALTSGFAASLFDNDDLF